MDIFYDKVDIIIRKHLDSIDSKILPFDILDDHNSSDIKLQMLKVRQKEIKIGKIWQEILGSYRSFKNLGVGHYTGLDIISEELKIIIELKNRTNTDNSSSKKYNFMKLAKFKKDNPDYRCIYGCINCKNKKETLNGKNYIFSFQNTELEYICGYKLLELILEENTGNMIEYIKNQISSL